MLKSFSFSSKVLPVIFDLTTTGVKLIQLAKTSKNSLKLTCIDKEPYPAQFDETEDKVKSAVAKLVERNEVGGNCAITISNKDVMIYDLTFAPMPKVELEAAVRYRLSQMKPYNLDIEHIVFKFMKWPDLTVLPKTNQQRLWVACMPQDIVRDRIRWFKQMGFNTIDVGIPTFSLVNISPVVKKEGEGPQINIWFNIDNEESFLVIEIEGAMCFWRNMTLTTKQIDRAVAQYCHISEEDAEQLKIKHGLNFWTPEKKIPSPFEITTIAEGEADDSERVYYSLFSLLENVVVDIEHTFKSFSYQGIQSQIGKFDRVILTGDGTNIPNLDKFLESRLGALVERADVFKEIEVPDVLREEKKSFIEAGASFGVAMGLAIGQQKEIEDRINMFPGEAKPSPFSFSELAKYFPIVLVVITLAFAIHLFRGQLKEAAIYSEKAERAKVSFNEARARLSDEQTADLNLAQAEAEVFNKKELLQARLKLLAKGVRSPESFSSVLERVAELLPAELWVRELSYKEGKLAIAGATPDIAMVSNLMNKLKASDEFVSAEFSYTQKDQGGGNVYDFEVIAEVKR
ncbi:MAG: pilus assembly protein PilM [Candidatus Omnitrophota bacterium]